VTTRENTYDTPPGVQTNGMAIEQPSTYTPPPYSNLLYIDKTTFDALLRAPKRVIQEETFNPNSHTTQNYNIIEYLVQAPCAMSSL
jgi:hypothetical protein